MFHLKSKFLAAACAGSFFAMANLAQADWATLNGDNSSVSFVSTKLKDFSEVHFFETVTGSISDTGSVSVLIDAASVNSGLEIRDGRMDEFLFMAADYPQITITAEVDLDSLAEGMNRMEVPATLSLKDTESAVVLDAFVAVSDSSITVSSAVPTIVFAAQVGLSEGVAKLAELAGGIAVGGSVPVTFSLSFDR
jgi:polyisoprenoid-binding protein YceI